MESVPALDQALQREVERSRIVGLSFAVTVDQELRYLKGLGMADLDEPRRVDPRRSIFRWASVSKGLVGLIAARAQIDENLDLEVSYSALAPDLDHPNSYLPSDCEALNCVEALPAEHEPISLRRLLDHTAGILHYSNGLINPTPPQEAVNDPAINTGMAWALELFLNQPLVALPGSTASYSSFGYNLAGVILEEALGQSLASRAAQVVANPLAMDSFGPDYHWEPDPHRVVGYTMGRGADIFRDGDDDVSWKLAAGGFRSSPVDFAAWCAGLMGDGLMSDSAKSRVLWSPQAPNSQYSFGFINRRDEETGRLVVQHDGAQQSTRTALRAYPEERLCFTLMTNSTWVNAMAVLARMEQVWRQQNE